MLTVKEVAKILCVTKEAVYNYINYDGLTALKIKIGKQMQYRISRQSFEDFKMSVLKYPFQVKFVLRKIHKVGDVFEYEGKTYKIVKLISIDLNTYEHQINVILV